MKGFLYTLTFANGKMYVGITTRPARRFREHKVASERGINNSIVYRAWRMHGDPVINIVGEFYTKEDLLSAEFAAIAEYRTLTPDGYNMTPGGDTNPMDIPEIARRAAEKNIGRKHSADARANMGNSRRGRKATAEHCAKISAGQKGKVLSAETKEKIRAKAIGRKVSDASREKQSRERKGIKRGPMANETKMKLSNLRREYWKKMREENPSALNEIIAKSAAGIKKAWDRRKGVE